MAINSKGRNTGLLRYRNEKLLARYYYYSHILEYKYSRCMEALSLEFDLTQNRINTIINKHSSNLYRLERQGVDVQALRKTYPFMVWHNPPSSHKNNARQLSLNLFSKVAP